MFRLVPYMVIFLSAAAARAQGLEPPLKDDIGGISGFVETLLRDIVIPVGIPIVTIAIIYSGFLFVTAQGSDEKLNKAKKALMWTLVGTAVFLGAWVIASLIEGTVGQLSE